MNKNLLHTMWCKILMEENIDEFDEFSVICQYCPYQNFLATTAGDPALPEIK